ncbi:restriction endonuclease subunit S [Vibrio parahaemolyticus]|uniref:restriction endonuclease subunit S n=1 Tax=Vibrio parahaemolyticus TaxID=670 RepID=UPI0021CF46AB|nr:restriction endonuclease subunit S [Vibrio parahaemolyticus]EJM7149979.1 restriction endonuclease subunit S [Vibrio parahaemolyticus]MCW7969079.1 restriction endonuclease subunit S [Vibrio parahaemolyticus]
MAVDNLITEHIDIWTSAVKTKSASGRGSSKKLELYGVKKLRELILELAVRGKLVPQDPNDEPASLLLERITAEKARLVKEQKIKKPKQLPAISESEIIEELPKSWELVRIGCMSTLENGDRSKNYPNKSVLVESGIPFVNAGHLVNSRINEAEMTYITQERFDLLRAGKFNDGDILFCLRGSLGKCAIVENFGIGAIASSLVIVKPEKSVIPEYLLKFFESPLSLSNIRKYDNGTAQPNLSASDLAKFVIPLPPLNEQHRIVAKVDELMALCDQLEQQTEASIEAHQVLVTTLLDTLTNSADADELMQNWARISEHFDTLFTTEESIDQLKQTILQLAVMGKLVSQDPNDEPASELLKRIAEEKAQLVKEKKIKKQKALPPISEDEKSFELPNGWSYERLGNICEKMGSGSTPRGGQSAYVTEGIPFLRSQNVWNGELKLNDIAYIPQETHDKMENTKVYPGDVLLNITGASLGRSTIFPEEIPEANVSQHVTIIRLIEPKMKEFIHIGIISPLIQNLVWGRQVGMAIEGLSKKVLEQFEFPVPPLEEQKLIVEKVTELLNICENLKVQLVASQTTQIQLTDSIVDQVV